MTNSLRRKTVHSFLWVTLDTFGQRILQFAIGIILARLLLPEEYGLIGLIAVFIAFSVIFIDTGFSFALIRKSQISEEEFCTVFWFNLAVSVLFYAFLWVGSPFIAGFFKEPSLVSIVRWVSLSLVINAVGSIQNVNLRREMRFKEIALIGACSKTASGAVAVVMAFNGFGVWSLVAQQLIMNALNTILMLGINRFIPRPVFSVTRFRELFGFSSKLLYSGISYSVVSNIYPLVIGRVFTVDDVGYFNRALGYQQLPVLSFTGIIQQVTVPSFSKIQDDADRYRSGYRKAIQLSVFVIALPLVILFIAAKPLIVFLITDKWLPCVPMLKILVIGGIFYPLSALNVNMIGIKGRSDLVMILQFIKDFMTILGIGFGLIWGIQGLVVSYSAAALFGFFLNAHFANKVIDYSIPDQIRDILPILSLAVLSGQAGYVALTWFGSDLMKIAVAVVSTTLVYGLFSHFMKLGVLKETMILLREITGKR